MESRLVTFFGELRELIDEYERDTVIEVRDKKCYAGLYLETTDMVEVDSLDEETYTLIKKAADHHDLPVVEFLVHVAKHEAKKENR